MRTSMRSTRAAALRLSAVLAVAASACARAGHPMLTEDSGTQGAGNFELESGNAWSSDRGVQGYLFQPQLSYGASTGLDLIVQPAWLDQHGGGATALRGVGDTALDFKWRFFGSDPLSLAVRAGFGVPTSAAGLGLPGNDPGVHAILVATWDLKPFTVDANVGMSRNPAVAGQRSELYHLSAATLYAANEHLALVADVDADSNPDATRRAWPAVVLVGAIYTVVPGLDVDAGYRGRLTRAAVAAQSLLGVTYRWAP